MQYTTRLFAAAILLLATSAPSRAASARSVLLVPTQFPTIQSAVNAANSGDVIQILAGVYPEQIAISTSITLTGAGASSSVIQAPPSLTSDRFGVTFIVEVTGTRVSPSQA
jgi:pectin methylesterase-like acyl-CoA thioesterase